MTPMATASYNAGQAMLQQMHENVRAFATSYVEKSNIARAVVADFYHADPSDIAFINTTSLGMNILALQLKKDAEDKNEIITLQDEFPSSTFAWQRQGFAMRFVEPNVDNTYNIDAILAKITEKTSAVVVSYVQFGTGARLNIESLSYELKVRGIPFILNATQAAGVIPIDVKKTPVSAMLVSGNKWLMSGTGAAILYLSPEMRTSNFPSIVGWLSAKNIGFDNRLNELNPNAPSLEVGLYSLLPVMCLQASIEFIQSIGIANVYDRVTDLSSYLITQLQKKGANIITPLAVENRAGIVAVVRPDAKTWVAMLEEKGIIAVLRGEDMVRISPHFYNNYEDIDALIELW